MNQTLQIDGDYNRYIAALIKRFRRRLLTLGVKPKDARKVSWLTKQKLSKMDLNQALSYLKASGDLIVWNITGLHKPSWVRASINRGSRQIPNIYSPLKGYDDQLLFRIAKAARLITLPSQTPSQVRKVVDNAMCSKPASSDSVGTLRDLIIRGFEYLQIQPKDYSEFTEYPTLWPFVAKRRDQGAGALESLLKDAISMLKASPISGYFNRLPYIRDSFHGIFYPVSASSVDKAWDAATPWAHPKFPDRFVAGEIHATQEPGGKLRMFASPYPIWQALLSPLHSFMKHIRHQIPGDCDKDQRAGALKVQQWLKEGRTVYCYDQESATCLSPVDAQIQFLEYLGVRPEDIALFELVSKATWVVGEELINESNASTFPNYIFWRKGQPLGIRPSMSTYATCHILLCYGIGAVLGVDASDFVVELGDDIAISHPGIAHYYKLVLEDAGCRINLPKSWVSNEFAEFAGYIITSDFILRPGKWRELDYLNVLSLFDEFGGIHSSELNLLGKLSPDVLSCYSFNKGDENWEIQGGCLNYSDALKVSSYLDAVHSWRRQDLPIGRFLSDVISELWDLSFGFKPVFNQDTSALVSDIFESVRKQVRLRSAQYASTTAENVFSIMAVERQLGSLFNSYRWLMDVHPLRPLDIAGYFIPIFSLLQKLVDEGSMMPDDYSHIRDYVIRSMSLVFSVGLATQKERNKEASFLNKIGKILNKVRANPEWEISPQILYGAVSNG